jgi:hypothetical protein
MILWRGKSKACSFPERSRIRYRIILEVTSSSLSLKKEVLSQAGHWKVEPWTLYQLCWYFGAPQFGFRHAWYDGPNCSFAFGFLIFSWHQFDCKKCDKNLKKT